MSADVESAVPQGNIGAPPPQQQSILQQSSHPVALVFHLLFRTCALVFYLILSYAIKNFILVFVITVLLLSFDFWTVKNVTGRLLVGLRWWNTIKPDGSNDWVFESKPLIPECFGGVCTFLLEFGGC
ncbi:DUF846-domain-containing protein [Rozella allomycis CSF55]|uniref:Golgi apparatus membrane protein TVP23 n=1 Tax=Rozella allomycis (strain CSF55) TaxID=988480 RepID=A0A075AT40_ROZAC|nr:Protein of unknown function DUF846, eukaryotic domain-containing protein [Rozella allomycis CSF55]RKP19698.1 DUF846-domain-containing protein [Rozella allomycis CSF55]|eukprot:EPZ31668.1 Protein of unknown function DUF846, eukaryotic domain-containing protein [Rozella allomycis CSF55]